MDPKGDLTPVPKAQQRHHSRWRHAVSLLLSLLGLAVIAKSLAWKLPSHPTQNLPIYDIGKDEDFSWENIRAEEALVYTNCYDGLQCARLILPMDPFNGTTNDTIELAVIRRPATVPITDPRYGGAILTNPGGPGGSGIGFLLRAGEEIQGYASSDAREGKQFDIISFDPRGVNETRPQVQCFESDAAEYGFILRYTEEGLLDSSDAALGRIWGMTNAKGQSCSIIAKDGKADIKQYVSTAYVAHDMLSLVEKHGEWRQKEAARLLSQGCGRAKKSSVVPDHLAYHPGQEKIQYWGFSYGTYLGNTFAAMYPDRVGRLLVDGVVDADNYRAGVWSNNLLDTEKAMDSFYSSCARAGNPTCALAGTDDKNNTPAAIKSRVENIVKHLYHNPLPVIGPNPEVITYSDIRILIFLALYSPNKLFPRLAKVLKHVEDGNAPEFASELLQRHIYQCRNPKYDTSRTRLLTQDAIIAIACSDGDDQTKTSVAEFKQHIEDLKDESPTLGSIWSQIRLNCIHYSVKAQHRFVGPWTGKTSHPLLMIGNTADPVTPVAFAHKMAAGFEGAVALTQVSPGHCSTSSFCNCTINYIKDYFQTGRLPPVNTTCVADEYPFGPEGNLSYVTQDLVVLTQARIRHARIRAGLEESGGMLMSGSRLGVKFAF